MSSDAQIDLIQKALTDIAEHCKYKRDQEFDVEHGLRAILHGQERIEKSLANLSNLLRSLLRAREELVTVRHAGEVR